MAEHKMTFEVENGITKAKIDGVYMGGGKSAKIEADESQIKDVVEDTVKANPELSGEESNLEGLRIGEDKYKNPVSGHFDILSTDIKFYDENGDEMPVEITKMAFRYNPSGFKQLKTKINPILEDLQLSVVNTPEDLVSTLNMFTQETVANPDNKSVIVFMILMGFTLNTYWVDSVPPLLNNDEVYTPIFLIRLGLYSVGSNNPTVVLADNITGNTTGINATWSCQYFED